MSSGTDQEALIENVADRLGVEPHEILFEDEEGPVTLHNVVKLWDELINSREMLKEPEVTEYDRERDVSWET
jgi:asparagine synthetase B (glutamine-hydrolysing)